MATEELAEKNRELIQKHFDDEKRMEQLRGSSCWGKSYIHVREVPELKDTESFMGVLRLNKDVPELLEYWEKERGDRVPRDNY